jgi:hypothetical protein
VVVERPRRRSLFAAPPLIAHGRIEHLEHGQKKLLAFFVSDMLQLFDFELRPYRSNGSI